MRWCRVTNGLIITVFKKSDFECECFYYCYCWLSFISWDIFFNLEFDVCLLWVSVLKRQRRWLSRRAVSGLLVLCDTAVQVVVWWRVWLRCRGAVCVSGLHRGLLDHQHRIWFFTVSTSVWMWTDQRHLTLRCPLIGGRQPSSTVMLDFWMKPLPHRLPGSCCSSSLNLHTAFAGKKNVFLFFLRKEEDLNDASVFLK